MKVMMVFGLGVLLSSLGGCDSMRTNGQVGSQSNSKTKGEKWLEGDRVRRKFIDDTRGVIVLDGDKYKRDSFVQIYNSDGSLWYKFSYYYDDSDGKYDYDNENFRPFAFHPDYFVLAMTCLSENDSDYEVIVNEKTELRKFVRKSDASLKFETWEDLILSSFSVDFDRMSNPLRESIQGKLMVVDSEVNFHPLEIRGEWIKVRVGDSKRCGWVKWKENGSLQIELYFFA